MQTVTLQYLQAGERTIVRALIRALIDAAESPTLTVTDGEEIAIKNTRDQKSIEREMGHTGIDVIRAHRSDGEPLGSFCLIYGNESWAVINDYADNEFCNRIIEQVQPTIDKVGGC